MKRIEPATMKRLQLHNWPGNIRELMHAVERAVILSESNSLKPHDFFSNQHDTQEEGNVPNNYNLEDTEKLLIRKALDKYNGNISKASKELGLTRASLYRRIEKYGI